MEVCDVFDVVAGRTKAVAEAAKLMKKKQTTSRAVGQIIALNGQQPAAGAISSLTAE